MVSLLHLLLNLVVLAAGGYAAFRVSRLVRRWRAGHLDFDDLALTVATLSIGSLAVVYDRGSHGIPYFLPIHTAWCGPGSYSTCFPRMWHWGLVYLVAAGIGFVGAQGLTAARRRSTSLHFALAVAAIIALVASVGFVRWNLIQPTAVVKYAPKFGRVVDSSGRGIEGAYVSIWGSGDEGRVLGWAPGGDYLVTLRTDAAGRYAVGDTRQLARSGRGGRFAPSAELLDATNRPSFLILATKPGYLAHSDTPHADPQFWRAGPIVRNLQAPAGKDGRIEVADLVLAPVEITAGDSASTSGATTLRMNFERALSLYGWLSSDDFDGRRPSVQMGSELRDDMRRELRDLLGSFVCALPASRPVGRDSERALGNLAGYQGFNERIQMLRRVNYAGGQREPTAGLLCGALEGVPISALAPTAFIEDGSPPVLNGVRDTEASYFASVPPPSAARAHQVVVAPPRVPGGAPTIRIEMEGSGGGIGGSANGARELSGLRSLGAIVYSAEPTARSVELAGRVLREGENHDGVTVIEIGSDSVLVQIGAEAYRVRHQRRDPSDG